MITSTHNDRVKLAHALQHEARLRRKSGKIVLEGARLVRDAVERGGYTPRFVLHDSRLGDDPLLLRLAHSGVAVLPASDEVMRYVSATEQPQGVVAVFDLPLPALPPTPSRLLILDDIRDPGNLGTMLRTAAAAGVSLILLSPGCADAYNPKVLRAGMGAHFRIPVVEMDWAAIGTACAGLRVYLADMTGDVSYDDADWSAAWALIIGSEAHGASAEAEALAQARVYIPMAAEAESLNAAVAAGILLFEAARHGKTEGHS
jgi:TrmH family RNA methyltransferase